MDDTETLSIVSKYCGAARRVVVHYTSRYDARYRFSDLPKCKGCNDYIQCIEYIDQETLKQMNNK